MWPGGSGGTRRKHRPGWAGTRRTSGTSASGSSEWAPRLFRCLGGAANGGKEEPSDFSLPFGATRKKKGRLRRRPGNRGNRIYDSAFSLNDRRGDEDQEFSSHIQGFLGFEKPSQTGDLHEPGNPRGRFAVFRFVDSADDDRLSILHQNLGGGFPLVHAGDLVDLGAEASPRIPGDFHDHLNSAVRRHVGGNFQEQDGVDELHLSPGLGGSFVGNQFALLDMGFGVVQGR